MRYGLYGIGGVYNFGCEAIVRGAVQFLRDLDDDSEIVYFSHNYAYDISKLKDLKIKIINVNKKINFCQRVINYICRKLRIEYAFSSVDYKAILSNCDKILSIGGDIYTIPQIIREQKKYMYLNNLVEICKIFIKHDKEVIVYGASVGPFGSYIHAINYYKKNLKKYKLIICREYRSIEYLKSLGITYTKFLPDPAFLVKDISRSKLNKEYIGLNLSPLSLKEIYGYFDNDTIQRMVSLIQNIYLKFNKDILLIPHVFSKTESDDDYRFLKKIKEMISPKFSSHIHMIEEDIGFLGTKNKIKQCEIVISARMHCCVNAICENVPAIFLSYSDKSKGMCKYIYNTERYAINLKSSDFEKSLMETIELFLNDKDKISLYLEERNNMITSEYQNNLIDIKEILNGYDK